MSIIKGILRHSRKEGGGGEERGFRGKKRRRVQKFKRYILRALRVQQGKGKKKGTK